MPDGIVILWYGHTAVTLPGWGMLLLLMTWWAIETAGNRNRSKW